MQLQRENGKFYVSMVKNEDPSIITALTVCDDLQALEDLMAAYIRVGHIRNQSNHALPYGGESDSPFPGKHDSSKLFTDISECISYFIQCYDTVYAKVEGKHPTVITVTADEVKTKQLELEKTNND